MLGAPHVVWHMPLFLIGNIRWSDVAFLPAFAVVLTCMHSNRGCSQVVVPLRTSSS